MSQVVPLLALLAAQGCADIGDVAGWASELQRTVLEADVDGDCASRRARSDARRRARRVRGADAVRLARPRPRVQRRATSLA